MNIFDKMQDNLHKTINGVFGYMVLWNPQNGDPQQIAKCLYKSPTEIYKLGELQYSPSLFQIEYKAGDLPGLYESVRENTGEEVTIYAIGAEPETGTTYVTMKAHSVFDGKTYKIIIDKA
jgi:hypothetical protein